MNVYRLNSRHDLIVRGLKKLFPDEDAEQMLHQARTRIVVALCVLIYRILISAILVAGVYRKNRKLVLIFIICFSLLLIANTIAIFYAFYDPSIISGQMTSNMLRKNYADASRAIIYTIIIVYLGLNGFYYYLLVGTISYYKELETAAPTKEHRQFCNELERDGPTKEYRQFC